MYLIVGLGNPGERYAGTRHNVGYAVVDCLAARHGISINRLSHRALVGSGTVGGHRVMLAKPVTYMNLSGEPVASLSRYYSLEPPQVWVVLDDAALPLGTLRLRLKGTSGGHHGLESIEEHLGTQEYRRFRLGIGSGGNADLVAHVLSRFGREEEPVVEAMIEIAADAIETALSEGFEIAMSRFNGPVAAAEEARSRQ